MPQNRRKLDYIVFCFSLISINMWWLYIAFLHIYDYKYQLGYKMHMMENFPFFHQLQSNCESNPVELQWKIFCFNSNLQWPLCARNAMLTRIWTITTSCERVLDVIFWYNIRHKNVGGWWEILLYKTEFGWLLHSTYLITCFSCTLFKTFLTSEIWKWKF